MDTKAKVIIGLTIVMVVIVMALSAMFASPTTAVRNCVMQNNVALDCVDLTYTPESTTQSE